MGRLLAVALLVVGTSCGGAAQPQPTTTTTTVAIGDGTFDEPFPTTTTTTRPRTTTTFDSSFIDRVLHRPEVASPFSASEHAFLMMLALSGLNHFAGVSPTVRPHPDGIDRNNDGDIDIGWEDLTFLKAYVTIINFGNGLCGPGAAEDFINTSNYATRQEREDFALIAVAWLC